MYESKKGTVHKIGTDKNRNPIKRKAHKDINNDLKSRIQTIRNHAYCQPDFCAFYIGSKNCDGTYREVQDPNTQTIWCNSIDLSSILVEASKADINRGTSD